MTQGPKGRVIQRVPSGELIDAKQYISYYGPIIDLQTAYLPDPITNSRMGYL